MNIGGKYPGSPVEVATGQSLRNRTTCSSIHLLIVPIVMLRSRIFGRVTAYTGILAAILNWALYIPTIGNFLSVLFVVPLAIWNIRVARTLLKLGGTS